MNPKFLRAGERRKLAANLAHNVTARQIGVSGFFLTRLLMPLLIVLGVSTAMYAQAHGYAHSPLLLLPLAGTIVYPVAHLPMLGKGSLLIDVFDATGASTGYQHMGNASKFDQEQKDDMAELYQSINAVPTLIATATKKRKIELAITGTDFSSKHMAIAMASAGVTTLSTGTTPVTGEALAAATVTKKGKYFATIGRDITTVAVKQGATTLVANTDYVVVDAPGGIIYFPLTSAVVDSTAVTVDYTPGGATYDQVAGAVVPFVKGKLRFVPDPTDGQKIGVEWWTVNLSPNGKLGIISDDYGNWELAGNVLADTANHPSDPYFLQTFY